ADFEREKSRENIVNTLNVLLENNYIPIINENDTVATDEIQFGDNDKLAALTAALIGADLVIIATNTDGIYTKESINLNSKKTILKVDDLTALRNEIADGKSSQGTGGMLSKIEAAEILKNKKIDTWILNGIGDNFMINAINEKIPFTKILNNTE
ncbi:MAG: glutamate 5-kinase, partial [Flavobacteriaceae bacterium]